jgi:hypothetical protein
VQRSAAQYHTTYLTLLPVQASTRQGGGQANTVHAGKNTYDDQCAGCVRAHMRASLLPAGQAGSTQARARRPSRSLRRVCFHGMVRAGCSNQAWVRRGVGQSVLPLMYDLPPSLSCWFLVGAEHETQC